MTIILANLSTNAHLMRFKIVWQGTIGIKEHEQQKFYK